MNDVTKTTAGKPHVPEEAQSRWQRIVDLISMILNVPAGLIMRAYPPQIEVFLSSGKEGNPFRKGQRVKLAGSYCERVMREGAPLLVSDALKDPNWNRSPWIERGLTFYLGFPIFWPDKEIFGTICIFDRKENPQATKFQELLSQFRLLIERDLFSLVEAGEGQDLLVELKRNQGQLKKIVAEQSSELEKNKEDLEEHRKFEELVSALFAIFVNLPQDLANFEIGIALKKICDFLQADVCSFLEAHADFEKIESVNIYRVAEVRREKINILASRNPWAHHKLVEEREPVIFSSLEAFPPEAGGDRAYWEQQGVQSVLILPIAISGQVRHFIVLGSRFPREWPLLLIQRLNFLGEVLTRGFLRIRAKEALIKRNHELAEAQRVAHLGSWEWDFISRTQHWSDEFYRIFGLPPQEIEATYETFLASVHPDDRQAVEKANKESISDPGRPYSIEYRVVRPDGTERVVHASGVVFFDPEHRPMRMIGTLHDITERQHAENELKKAYEEIKKLKEQLEAENIYLREEIKLSEGFKDIIGVSNPIKYVTHRVQQVAPTSTTVLLTGETGTGKGLFARALHQASDRRDKPFVNVNCAGLPPNLIESELFGREKGAFTGSTARQIGRFELANKGTIFLDEIGDLPLELQSKLLKVIEDGEFERLGSPHTVKVDVRIIASTNRDLEEEIKKGLFRKDLFYRLNVFPITIPALKQRRGDIPILVKFYAEKFSKKHGKNIEVIPKNTMKALENYAWPGNVRELINVIERAVIVSEGPELRLAEKIDALPVDSTRGIEGKDTQETKGLAEMEREHILKTLEESGWRIEGPRGSAQLLGMNPSTLKGRMRKLGIKRPRPD